MSHDNSEKECENSIEPSLIALGQKLQALAQTGLTFTKDRYDIERYKELREIAAQFMARRFSADQLQFAEEFVKQRGYATPKVDTRAIVLRKGKLLMVKEADDKLWSLPGGWADVGDTPSDAVCREVLEETGLSVRVERLAGVWDRNLHGHPPYPWHVYKLIFFCKETGGDVQLSADSIAIEFFDPCKLPPLSLTRIVPIEIETSLDIIHNNKDAWYD
ncbi:NUDIX hydrolase [Acerihabitans sp. KWT182]|uniref:NUDIX hydrolase n=1 Tax=Acerihabitans sp. KWT182 TaxID=3157919 RepID=A0AAU7Q978_9GAMM